MTPDGGPTRPPSVVDTIAAVATPSGRGGIGIVRLSGPHVPDIAARLGLQPLTPRHAHYRQFADHDGTVIDSGLALLFSAPASFTGEDVLELHAHGGPVVLDLLLRRVLNLGARLARPGEFSERAFLNDKIDLAQAEAVADLIHSASEQAARAAQRSLQGEFSRRIHQLVERLVQLRTLVEAAIVTDVPGTTRDLLSEHIQIDGMPLHIIDTAGLRPTEEPVEQEGIRRARQVIEDADRVLLVLDARVPEQGEDALQGLPPGLRVTRIHNKIDLTEHTTHVDTQPERPAVYLSAKTGAGLDLLRSHLKDCIHFNSEAGAVFIARRRHLEAFDRTRRALGQAGRQAADGSLELLAEDLREAQNALAEITGEFTNEDLLSRIFASFCIGK
ncbi:MAG: tRNA modification GTPase [Methylotetracoccus sp.]|nr:tRNA modification GTPase [Methylotetracoccus sp.]